MKYVYINDMQLWRHYRAPVSYYSPLCCQLLTIYNL